MQIFVGKEIINEVGIEIHFSRRNFCPFHLEVGREPVRNLDLPKASRDLADFVLRTPYGPQHHDGMPVMLKVAALIAVDIEGAGHCILGLWSGVTVYHLFVTDHR